MSDAYVVTINVAIICSTLITALYLLRRTIDRVSKQKHTVFMLQLPFGITWMLAGGEKGSEIEEVVKIALLRRAQKERAEPPPPDNAVLPTELSRTSEQSQPG